MPDLSKYRKAVVSVIGTLALVATVLLQFGNVVPDKYTPILVAIIGVATSVGVYQKPNNTAGAPGQDGQGL
jgi:hypothetical protein